MKIILEQWQVEKIMPIFKFAKTELKKGTPGVILAQPKLTTEGDIYLVINFIEHETGKKLQKVIGKTPGKLEG